MRQKRSVYTGRNYHTGRRHFVLCICCGCLVYVKRTKRGGGEVDEESFAVYLKG